MKLFRYLCLIGLLSCAGYGCEKQSNDEFPRARFTGFFDLRDPLYSGDSFSANRDMYGDWVGIAGIIVYRASATEYYAFEQMCPHEKKITCHALLDPQKDPFIAECECCGSQFLITSEYSGIIKGPSKWPLKKYQTSVKGSILMVSSF